MGTYAKLLRGAFYVSEEELLARLASADKTLNIIVQELTAPNWRDLENLAHALTRERQLLSSINHPKRKYLVERTNALIAFIDECGQLRKAYGTMADTLTSTQLTDPLFEQACLKLSTSLQKLQQTKRIDPDIYAPTPLENDANTLSGVLDTLLATHAHLTTIEKEFQTTTDTLRALIEKPALLKKELAEPSNYLLELNQQLDTEIQHCEQARTTTKLNLGRVPAGLLDQATDLKNQIHKIISALPN